MARVTVGVPVYNGVSLIRECLNCLVDQTYGDLEIVISDNASTDGTSEICAEFSQKYENVTHMRHSVTSDTLTNFQFLLDNARSPLFLWRAFDDLSSPDFIESLVGCFDANPECELAISKVIMQSITLNECVDSATIPAPNFDGLDDITKVERMLMECSASWFYGLWDRTTLQSNFCQVRKNYSDVWGADHLTLFPLIVRNKICVDFQAHFIARLENTEQRRSSSYGFTAGEMARMRASFRSYADISINSQDMPFLNTKEFRGIIENYIDRVLFSRSKIRRTQLREAVPFGLGKKRR